MLQGRYEPDFAAMRYARKHLKNITVRDALRRMFDDPQLCELLALPSIYVGSFPEQCSYLYFLHVVYANLYMRSAYMDGGSQRLSNLLVEQIRARGGEVVLNVNVERILVDKSAMRATGVATDRGEFLARRFWSTLRRSMRWSSCSNPCRSWMPLGSSCPGYGQPMPPARFIWCWTRTLPNWAATRGNHAVGR
ncbi:phytoene desaturase [Chromobacterium violaceum]|uniref:Phytoene desaturase n=1 Tax=Chromobacterium violaceum TaxID=536 RepID=A0A447TA42_CHRVL|nr:phytoene desaturase [Chromobacterium violaceum]